MIKNNAICPIPWNHISIQQNGDFRICCQHVYSPYGKLTKDNVIANINNVNIDEVRNYQEIKDLRAKMLNGIRDPICKLCYQEEDSGLQNKRQKMLELYTDNFITDTDQNGAIDTTKFPLRYIDIRFGNLCNLKCRYCGPIDSSLWYEDYANMSIEQPVTMNFYGTKTYEIKKINNVWDIDSSDFKWYENEKVWNQLKSMIPYIDRYYFTGGEPTINKTHFELLQMIIDMGHAKTTILEYNTNMWAIPDNLYKKWSHFKSIEIGCSIDGIKEMTNYLRPPSTWDRIEKNLDKLGNHNLSNITATISATISVFNIIHFIELTKWLIEKNYKNIRKIPTFHMLVYPDCMNIQVLPQYVKKYIEQQYLSFYTDMDVKYGNQIGNEIYNIYSGITSFMYAKDNSNLLPDLKHSIESMDTMRGQNIRNIIPWLWDIIHIQES